MPWYITAVPTNGTFPYLQYKSKNFWGFDVSLEPPVSLIKDNRHYIEADISGPPSFGGRGGNIDIESSGVAFNFETRKKIGLVELE